MCVFGQEVSEPMHTAPRRAALRRTARARAATASLARHPLSLSLSPATARVHAPHLEHGIQRQQRGRACVDAQHGRVRQPLQAADGAAGQRAQQRRMRRKVPAPRRGTLHGGIAPRRIVAQGLAPRGGNDAHVEGRSGRQTPCTLQAASRCVVREAVEGACERQAWGHGGMEAWGGGSLDPCTCAAPYGIQLRHDALDGVVRAQHGAAVHHVTRGSLGQELGAAASGTAGGQRMVMHACCAQSRVPSLLRTDSARS